MQNHALYERLARSYNVRFEGSSHPVFYKTFYPTGGISGPNAAALWQMYDYAIGLKRDRDPDRIRFERVGEATYVQDVRDLLDAVLEHTHWSRCAIAVIPSSTAGVTNRATEIVKSAIDANPTAAVDLTDTIVRTSDKQAAHLGGSRWTADCDDSLSIDPGIASIFETIVVVDDILTSGNSFKAFDRLLESIGFNGTIVNFAFAHTRASDAIEVCLDGVPNPHPAPISKGYRVTLRDGSTRCFGDECRVIQKARYRKTTDARGRAQATFDPHIKLGFGPRHAETEMDFDDLDDVKRRVKYIRYTSPIDGLVLDFDQTLLDNAVRDAAYEERLWKNAGPLGGDPSPSPYKTYPGVEGIVGLDIPFAIVSNRSEKQLSGILNKADIARVLYPEQHVAVDTTATSADVPENVFSFPKEQVDGYTVRRYKPSPLGVQAAVEWLCRDSLLFEDAPRIVGLGNTIEDIAAYNAAGIESALALWGVPEWCKDVAKTTWNAAHAFESIDEFVAWCREGGPLSR